jgi:hypothetical protein
MLHRVLCNSVDVLKVTSFSVKTAMQYKHSLKSCAPLLTKPADL